LPDFSEILREETVLTESWQCGRYTCYTVRISCFPTGLADLNHGDFNHDLNQMILCQKNHVI